MIFLIMPTLSIILIGVIAILLGFFPMFYRNFKVIFVPSGKKNVEIIKKHLNVKDDDVFMDLGSGFGNIVFPMIEGTKAKGIGIEISPFLFLISKVRSLFNSRVDIRYGDIFKADLSEATIVYCYFIPEMLDRLQFKLMKDIQPGNKIVSLYFPLVGVKPHTIIKNNDKDLAFVYLKRGD